MEEYIPDNRDRKRAPKKGIFYCKVCDFALVWEGRKCPVCGRRAKRRRNKKG